METQRTQTAAPRVLRVWRGATAARDAEEYVRYMSRTGFAALRATPGNLGVLGLMRLTGERAEHVVMSLWDAESSIRRFAGDDIGRAVFYPDDEKFLVEKDDHVDHFEVAFEDGWASR